MYDFDEVRRMNIGETKQIGVVEVMKPNHSRDVGKMNIASILSKFG